ncbi:hypothetical protein [Parafilimonas sp.]|uniref:hypothetical protein n=1 Tax=Parafilimonas sp. TaxID=1969739 RepID=UPI0039E40049
MENLDPEILSQNPTRLNEQQLQMLRLFKEPMADEDYKLIKKEILFLKAKKIDVALEQWEKENNISAEDYERWGKEHFRMPYNQK